ncbi:mitogen-activated protein kinase kinase [Homalodisca vitripennis]|nr:mitogen-activated protein kinase kinase [Homalodisca vitripennis]
MPTLKSFVIHYAERRRLKKINAQLASNNLTFNDSSSGIKSLPRIAPTEDRVGHSPARARPGIPKVKPLSQDHLFEKSKSGKLERMRLRERLRICQSIQSTGKLQVSPDSVYDFTSEDLQDQGEIGRGAFGTVNKMVHRKSSTVMAVKLVFSIFMFAEHCDSAAFNSGRQLMGITQIKNGGNVF